MITGAVTISLSAQSEDAETWHQDRRRIAVLDDIPDGARVVVNLGGRKYVSDDAVRWIHEHGERLLIEIQGRDPRIVERFVRASREGSLDVAL